MNGTTGYWWHCRCRCCGEWFLSARPDKKTCGPTCRQRHSRKKRGQMPFHAANWFRQEYDVSPQGAGYGRLMDMPAEPKTKKAK